MMKHDKKPSFSAMVTRAIVAALLLGGCQPMPPDPGTIGGRMDPYRSTGGLAAVRRNLNGGSKRDRFVIRASSFSRY